jgi:hypothetical protein
MILDFTVTTPSGKELSLSALAQNDNDKTELELYPLSSYVTNGEYLAGEYLSGNFGAIPH